MTEFEKGKLRSNNGKNMRRLTIGKEEGVSQDDIKREIEALGHKWGDEPDCIEIGLGTAEEVERIQDIHSRLMREYREK